MKNFIALIAIGVFAVLGTGCNLDDDIIIDTPIELPEAVTNFLAENYPDFQIRSSDEEDLCGDIPVLEVELEDGPGPDVDLYFTPVGEFLFVATDITVAELPEAVLATIANDFMDYTINPDDVERFDYPDGSVEYEVELVHNSTGEEDDAVFAADGSLICFDDDGDDDDDEEEDDEGEDDDDDEEDDEGEDDDDENNSVDLPEEVRDFIMMNYPGYEIRSAETEDICDDVLMYEVELEDGPGPDVELYFNLDWEFQFTQTEISANELPDAVLSTIAMNYADFEIDEDKVERQEWADGVLRFSLELESADEDLEIIFNADGSLYCLDD
ncbi:MAG: PepSY-like domain-containing protein [Bacteroidota bacterium]